MGPPRRRCHPGLHRPSIRWAAARRETRSIVTYYSARIARAARDWDTATTLQKAIIEKNRAKAAAALAAGPGSLTEAQRTSIRNLAGSLNDLGNVLYLQGDPGCLPYLTESFEL